MMKLILLLMIATQFSVLQIVVANEDLSTRLQNSFDTTPLAKTHERIQQVDSATQIKSQAEIEEEQYYSHVRRQKASLQIDKKTNSTKVLDKRRNSLLLHGSGETPFNSPTPSESYPYGR